MWGEGSSDASCTIVLYDAGALRHAAQLPATRSISRGYEGDRMVRQPQEGGSVRVFYSSSSDRFRNLNCASMYSAKSFSRAIISSCKCHSFGESWGETAGSGRVAEAEGGAGSGQLTSF